MLGKLWGKRSNREDSSSLDRLLEGPSARPTGNVPSNGGSTGASPIAKFEPLSQTLVATIVESALSGPNAQRLVHDLAAQAIYTDESGNKRFRYRHIVLDLQNVEYLDSGCIGSMVELLTEIKKRGGHVALANANHNVECLFKLTRLDRLFPICADVMKAIEAVERRG
ncbi:MAG: STAS domain-containing protein [Phycisphaerales bacterium]|jgi:anti-sigma B factor antagonist|nr:STAS domain-containing protein [Phycisphaerales bacterium]